MRGFGLVAYGGAGSRVTCAHVGDGGSNRCFAKNVGIVFSI